MMSKATTYCTVFRREGVLNLDGLLRMNFYDTDRNKGRWFSLACTNKRIIYYDPRQGDAEIIGVICYLQ